MASTVPALSALLKRTDIDDHEEVLRAAESALKQSKGDAEAQHVKVVALLKLDRYADAVKAVEAGGAQLKDTASLEYAYALYKSGKPAEAVEVLRGASQRGARHIQAQASYRIEDFKTAAELYRELAARPEEDAVADLRINSGAVDAQVEWAYRGELVKKKTPEREDMEAFETAYNAACGSIARGELAQGEILLKRARELCNSLDDMSEEDKQAELLPITVQQIYVLVRLGRHGEAESLSKTFDPQSIPDASTRVIAQVNGVAATSTLTNPFMTQRLLQKDVDSTGGPDHSFNYQSSILKQNRYALDLQSLKHEGTADSTAKTIAKQGSPNLDSFCNSMSVFNAAARAKGSTGKEALKHILPLLEQRPNDVGLILTIIQLYVLTGNSASATSLLETFFARFEQSGSAAEQDVRFAPGLVATMISLYHSQSQRARMEKEFAKAATYWRRKSKDGPAGVAHLLKAAGTSLLQSQDPEHRQLARDIFSDLCNQDSTDRYASAGLVAADPSSASAQQISTLQPVDRLIQGIDVNSLENAGVAQPASFAATMSTRKRPAEDSKPKKAKKIRKSRLPKDYDPSKTPDPERWLPLRDRSSYKPKGKKGKARANLLSQGAAPAGESDGSRPGTPGGQVVTQKQQGGGGGKNKKKAKKR